MGKLNDISVIKGFQETAAAVMMLIIVLWTPISPLAGDQFLSLPRIKFSLKRVIRPLTKHNQDVL